MTSQKNFLVEEQQAGRRLDQALSDLETGLSRSRLKQLIEQQHVRVNGALVDQPKRKVALGDQIQLTIPEPDEALHLRPEAIALDVVYEDEALLVVNKPAGMVVHPAAGNPSGTLVNALLHHCGDSLTGIGGVVRPGIVHRLDKDTSGLMVVAKTEAALAHLQAQFADRSIERAYDAFVWGDPGAFGEIETNIGRSRTHRQKMAVLEEPHGKPALTRFGRLALFGLSATWIECRLATGRTHQIRVHMAHLGHSLIGDPLYGKATPARRRTFDEAQNQLIADFGRQALHARILGFEHPVSGEWMRFERDCPQDMRDLAALLAQSSWQEVAQVAANNQAKLAERRDQARTRNQDPYDDWDEDEDDDWDWQGET